MIVGDNMPAIAEAIRAVQAKGPSVFVEVRIRPFENTDVDWLVVQDSSLMGEVNLDEVSFGPDIEGLWLEGQDDRGLWAALTLFPCQTVDMVRGEDHVVFWYPREDDNGGVAIVVCPKGVDPEPLAIRTRGQVTPLVCI